MTTKVATAMLAEAVASPADVALVAVPVGAGLPYWGATEPASNWMFADGRAISRSTYSVLFARYGVTYGSGDGSTTFNLPDLRGRVPVGRDDMGGSAASRITTGVSGIDGATLGAAGGDQRAQQHTHTVTDPGHNHTVTSYLDDTPNSLLAGGAGTASGSVTSSNATTGISLGNSGAGNSQNVQPSLISNFIIRVL